MRELFQKQEIERKKPIEEKAALVAEKDTLAAKVQQLERQLIDERTARAKADRAEETLRTRCEQVSTKSQGELSTCIGGG